MTGRPYGCFCQGTRIDQQAELHISFVASVYDQYIGIGRGGRAVLSGSRGYAMMIGSPSVPGEQRLLTECSLGQSRKRHSCGFPRQVVLFNVLKAHVSD